MHWFVIGYLSITVIFDLCSVFVDVVVIVLLVCFFFQAEDGIRDLVRSRGLGDVYKRQLFLFVRFFHTKLAYVHMLRNFKGFTIGCKQTVTSVSYTHLTLPTSDLV